jgi:hypothetical protein
MDGMAMFLLEEMKRKRGKPRKEMGRCGGFKFEKPWRNSLHFLERFKIHKDMRKC